MSNQETTAPKRPKLKDIDVHYKYDGTTKTHHIVGKSTNDAGRVIVDGDIKFTDAPDSERDPDDEPTPWMTIANSVVKAVAMCLYEIDRDMKASIDPEPEPDADDNDDDDDDFEPGTDPLGPETLK